MTETWRSVWERRTLAPGAPLTLESLIALDGFDGFGTVPDEDAWRTYAARIADRLGVVPADSIYDVGCGAGAFLEPFSRRGHRVGGLDFAPNLVAVARRALPDAELTVADARDLDPAPYDVVVSHSLFLYLPDEDHAAAVVRAMLRKARRSFAILDVPDRAHAPAALAFRRAHLGEDAYGSHYADLRHLSLGREWFGRCLAREAVEIAIHDVDLAGYPHGSYRFNVYVRRVERP
jgi:trans-aconitate methyltransferase